MGIDVERLVCFAVLMETGNGIVTKSPDYIREKYEACMKVPYPAGLLDCWNEAKLEEWRTTWDMFSGDKEKTGAMAGR
jgi:hypothetical protein